MKTNREVSEFLLAQARRSDRRAESLQRKLDALVMNPAVRRYHALCQKQREAYAEGDANRGALAAHLMAAGLP
jgi:hypothetical protein